MSSRPFGMGYTHPPDISWQDTTKVTGVEYKCGHCGNQVGPSEGYRNARKFFSICICPTCNNPTYVTPNTQVPGPSFGRDLEHLPEDVNQLYNEARRCMTVRSHTAVVLLGRKLLMHVAVENGAKPGGSFERYVDYLEEHNRIPEDSREWVDMIRRKGNVANHKIEEITDGDAMGLLLLVEALLFFAYDVPGRARQMPQTT